MNNPSMVQAGLILLGLVVSATASFSQTATNGATRGESAAIRARIIYTGKLLGYFRVPSRQSSLHNRCPDSPQSGNGGASEPAFGFLQLRRQDGGAILVGTGDNFAPQLEARVFNPGPAVKGGQYARGNKELFFGDVNSWVPYENPSADLEKRLAQGLGTIPNDNVGCFLAAAKYAAVVPGKHDFYFGAERVRQLARFMAGIDPSAEYAPVQMLAANLVLSTVPINDAPLLPREIKKPWFKTDWPENYPVLNLGNGSVYPWFSYVKLKLVELKPDPRKLDPLKNWFQTKGGLLSETALKELLGSQKDKYYTDVLSDLTSAIDGFSLFSVYRCPSHGAPNDILDPREGGCTPLLERQIGLVGNSLAYYFPLPVMYYGRDGHFSTVKSGENYGLCSVVKEKGKPNEPGAVSCLRFSTYTPFFYFPHQVPTAPDKKGRDPKEFTDPYPYVLTEDGSTAIFGVVDTNLGEQVGVLNFGWQNLKTKLKTVVGAEDPAEALRQQLDYFERRYREQHEEPFAGLKVLLAQMSPQRARVLSARLPDFQVVVTGADPEQGTSITRLETLWTPRTRAGSFVAVPLPDFNSENRAPVVHFSWVDASQQGDSWRLNSNSRDPVEFKPTDEPATEFWRRVQAALNTCLPARLHSKLSGEPPPHLDQLKWLTLCAMREETNADVALIQKRDLFDQIPAGTGDAPNRAQQILDRLIWKGDLLTLMYVPGSAIKQALKQSKTYKTEDSSPLSLADERWRQLEMLGIDTDPATNESLINEVPIEDKKVYAVATTDYIGAGDTGYPGLAGAALNPRTYPAGFPKEMLPISGVVCRKLYTDPKEADQYCLGKIDREKYLDQTIAEQVTPHRRPGFVRKFWDNFLFKLPPKDTAATTISGALQERIQRRPLWLFSLRNFSLGFSSLNNNFTDAEIDEKFAGVPTSSVLAHKNHSLTIGLNTRLSHLTHKREFFLAGGVDYKKQSTGIANDKPQVTQIANRAFADAGVTVRWPGRSLPHMGAVFSVHFETPLEQPFSTFSLATQTVVDPVNDIKVTDRLKITQGRSLTILPRAGLRWQNRESSFEIGVQAGREINALSGYRFNTQGVIVECLPSATETFADCIKGKSKTPNATITKDSEARAILQDRPRAGMYWKTNFSMAFGEKFKYELEQEANFFFVSFHRDNAIDTRFIDSSKHRFRFFIWPSISIGPTFRLLLFQNKVNRDFLVQKEFMFETNISFDVFNRREKSVQLKHKP